MADQQAQQQPPDGPASLTFDTFAGINTDASRPGIQDEQMYWCDGFMPLGVNNLRTLPGILPQPIYNAGTGSAVSYYDFGNLGSTPIAIVFTADGAIQEVKMDSLTVLTIAPPGTILSPTQGNVAVSQWGSQYIIIVAKQTNGYFIWDGVHLYGAGAIGPIVTVTKSGQGYTSQPTVTLSGGAGSGATFLADIVNGAIANISVTNPGAGYTAPDTPIVTITGGGADSAARATANISATTGGIQSVIVFTGGGGYSSLSSATVTGGGGTGASLAIQAINGTITAILVVNPGQGYTAAPSVGINDPASTPGSGFSGQATINTGEILTVTVNSGGTGYRTPPLVTVIGDGTGAVCQATINSAGNVTGVIVVIGGSGYTFAEIQFSGGNNGAEATVELMPFGVSGTEVETYNSQVWVTNGPLLLFSAPESIVDFATSAGGGASPSTDSFLRVAYIRPLQTNGFLYLIGDSSIGYISGVTTSGVPTTTTFSKQNADPEIGTAWADAIEVFSRNIVFGNPYGVHISYGGAVAKISDALNGVYNTVLNFGGQTPSTAKAIIYGRRVFMILVPVIDQVTGQQVNTLFMWDGKVWWSSKQEIALSFIKHQEFNSILTAYGTDGRAIYALFQQPSTGFAKTVKSKLWDKPGTYAMVKTASRLWGLVNYYAADGSALDISIDSEHGPSVTTVVAGPAIVTWTNATGFGVAWLTGSGDIAAWSTIGNLVVFPPIAVGQQGVLIGITLTTTASDVALISLKVASEPNTYRG